LKQAPVWKRHLLVDGRTACDLLVRIDNDMQLYPSRWPSVIHVFFDAEFRGPDLRYVDRFEVYSIASALKNQTAANIIWCASELACQASLHGEYVKIGVVTQDPCLQALEKLARMQGHQLDLLLTRSDLEAWVQE
jgi:hypothetical protein